MGGIPDWYRTIKAAQWLKVAPWDLIEKPLAWEEWALAAIEAEGEMKKKRLEKDEQKGKHPRIRRKR